MLALSKAGAVAVLALRLKSTVGSLARVLYVLSVRDIPILGIVGRAVHSSTAEISMLVDLSNLTRDEVEEVLLALRRNENVAGKMQIQVHQ